VWDGSVCLQTSQSSCSAAAAATLLKYFGIASSEEEMAQLCLTSEWGTCLHGLYRGLSIKTEVKPIHVKVRSANLNQLQKNVTLPAILNVRLDKAVAQRDPRYSNDWGWRIGVNHTVVLFGFKSNGLIEVGDPGTGREFWDMQALCDLWHGEYIILESYH
ncbi:MAG: cysteine peptidase family C39 domain-containing protein, partial [Planctomycetota bacterium]